MRFSPENESVEVSLSKQGSSCVIDVRDMGIGIHLILIMEVYDD